MAAPERMKWLDLTAHGVKLRLFQMTDKTVNLVLSGIVPGSVEWMAVQTLGFEPARSGRTLVRAGTDVQTGALRKIFPNNRIRDMELSEVWMRVTGQATSVARRPEDRAVLGRCDRQVVSIRPNALQYKHLQKFLLDRPAQRPHHESGSSS